MWSEPPAGTAPEPCPEVMADGAADLGDGPPHGHAGRRLPNLRRHEPAIPDLRPAVDVDLTASPPVANRRPVRPLIVDRPLGRIDHRPSAPAAPLPPARPAVDIDLTVPLPAEVPNARRGHGGATVPTGPPAPAPGVDPATSHAAEPPPVRAREAHGRGTAPAPPAADPVAGRHEVVVELQRWASRRVRRARRRLRAPVALANLRRSTVALVLASAVLVVAGAVAHTAHDTLQDRHEFLNVTAPLHRDPSVAADLSAQVAAELEADGVIAAGGSAEATAVIEQAILSEDFGPVWRSALSRAHDEALDGVPSGGDLVEEALPGLRSHLTGEGTRAVPDLDERSVRLVPADYVAELRNVVGLAGRAALLLPLGAVVLAAFTLHRSRNRMRAGALLCLAIATVAVATVVAIDPLADLVVSRAVAEPVRPFALAAAGGVGSMVRIVAVFVAVVAALLAVAGRLEEVHSAPAFPVEEERAGRRRRGGRTWRPRQAYEVYRASRSYRHYRAPRFARTSRYEPSRRWSGRRV